MIKWYSPEEKLPKHKDNIVLYNDMYHEIELYEVEVCAKKYIEDGYFYWAYASDFNFPSEVKNG